MRIDSSTIAGNEATYDGGLTLYRAGDVDVNMSTISNNTGSSGRGGIYYYNNSTQDSGVFRNLTITKNDGGSQPGAGIYLASNNQKVELYNSIVADNVGTSGGSATDIHGAFHPNSSHNLIGVSSTGTGIENNDSENNKVGTSSNPLDPGLLPLGEYGGPTQTHALESDSEAINVGSSTEMLDQRGFPRNVGGVDIGAVELWEGAPPADPPTDLIVSSTADAIDGNYAQGELTLREAVAIANFRPGSETITFDGGVFTGGSASRIRLTQGEVKITETLTIDGSTGTGIVISGDAADNDILVADPLITDVTASLAAALPDDNTLLDDNTRVFNFSSSTGDLTLNGLTITGGRTTDFSEDGGGIRFGSDGALTLTDSLISGNSTVDYLDYGYQAYGGGIATDSGSITLIGSTVSGNRTTGFGAHGGGIYNGFGLVTLIDSIISDNSIAGTDAYGGGMYTYSGTMILTGSTISGNSTSGSSEADGGGIFNDSGITRLTNSTVSNNDSSGDGGGIGTRYGSVTLNGSTVSGNSTTGTGHGGGIYTATGHESYSTSGRVSLTNSTVSGNRSGGHGGGIASGGDPTWQESIYNSHALKLTNSTVSDNEAAGEGGGVYVFNHAKNSHLTLENSIVAGNLDNKSPGNSGTPSDLLPDPDSTLTSNHSLIGVADGLTLSGTGNLTGTGAVPLDAGVAPLDDYGGPTRTHALLPNSPAIDAGDPSVLFAPDDFDQRGAGYHRVHGDRMDIGAVEAASPIISGPSDVETSEDVPLALSAANGNALSFTTLNAGSKDVEFTLQASVSFSDITFTDTTGVTVTPAAASSPSYHLHGTVSAINAVLAAGVSLLPVADVHGDADLMLTANDGIASTSLQLPITIHPVNDSPSVDIVLGSLTENDTVVNFVNITDVDGGNEADSFALTLDAGEGGVLNVPHPGLLTPVYENGNSRVTLSGLLSEVTAALATTELLLTQDNPPLDIPAFNFTHSFSGSNLAGGYGGGAEQPLFVTAVNDDPVVTFPAAINLEEEGTLAFAGVNAITVNDIDAGAADITFEFSVPAATGTFTLGDTSGLTPLPGSGANGTERFAFQGTQDAINAALTTLTFTAAENATDPFDMTFVVNDQGNAGSGGELVSTSVVPVTINPINDPPILDLDLSSVGIDFATTFTEGLGAVALVDTDAALTDADHAALTSLAITLTNPQDGTAEFLSVGNAQGLAVAGEGTHQIIFSGTAPLATYLSVLQTELTYNNISQNPHEVLDRIVEFVASDGTDSSIPAFTTVTVVGVNAIPSAVDDLAVVNEDGAVTLNPLGNDYDEDGTILTLASTTDGVHGTVTNHGDGTITYTPNANFSGSTSFTYTIQDEAGDQDVATVHVTVAPVNDAPQAALDEFVILEDSSQLSGNVIADNGNGLDSDAEGDTLTVTLGEGVGHGLLTLNSNGSFTYEPDEHFFGEDAFAYTVHDGNGGVDSGVVIITVTAVNDAPVPEDDFAEVQENQSVLIDVLGNDTDLEGDALSITRIIQGSKGIATLNADSTITYQANPNVDGPDTFQYEVSDDRGGTAIGTVELTIHDVDPASLGTIRGIKYHDLNTNGVRDTQLIVGDQPDVVFVIDVSWSTVLTNDAEYPKYFLGNIVFGDFNNDHEEPILNTELTVADGFNTVLDAELAGFSALNQRLIDLGFGDTAEVSIVIFAHNGGSDDAVLLDMNPLADGKQYTTAPNAMIGDQKVVDLILQNVVTHGFRGLDVVGDANFEVAPVDFSGGTNFEAALQQTIAVLNILHNSESDYTNDNVVFLSDGEPTHPIDPEKSNWPFKAFLGEVNTLHNRGTNLRAFGVGTDSDPYPLGDIDYGNTVGGRSKPGNDNDPPAIQFQTTDELYEVFAGLQSSRVDFTEPTLSTFDFYLDLDMDGEFDADEPIARSNQDPTTTDDTTGGFSFTNLVPGTYHLREIPQLGWKQTGPVNLGFYEIEVGPGETVFEHNFGNIEAPTVSIADATFTEADAGAVQPTYSITISESVSTAVTVDFELVDGTAVTGLDYQVVNLSTVIPANASSAPLDFSILGDQVVERLEKDFQIRLTSATAADGRPVGIYGGRATITIQDDDAAKVSITQAPVSVPEDAGTVSLDISLDHPVDEDVTVRYQLLPGMARAGEDYQVLSEGIVMIPAWATGVPISVAIQDDLIVEDDTQGGGYESFGVRVTEVLAIDRDVTLDTTADTATVTIDDNDSATVSINPLSLAQEETDDGFVDFSFAVTLSQPVDVPITVRADVVDIDTTAGVDYQTTAGLLVFEPGGPTTQQVVVHVMGETLVEDDEAFGVELRLVDTSGRDVQLAATADAVGTIINDDRAITLIEGARLVTTDADPSANGTSTEFTVPIGAAALRIGFSDLDFDAGSQQQQNRPDINDAFELSLLRKSDGLPVLNTIAAGSDAVFNITQGQDPAWPAGVELLDTSGVLVTNPAAGITEGFVQIDISALPAGEELVLVARLVNNDADDTTSVVVNFQPAGASQGTFALEGGSEQSLPTAANATTSIPFAVDFERLENVTSTFNIEYAHTSWSAGDATDATDNQLSVSANISKQGPLAVRNTLLVAVRDVASQDSASPSAARVKNHDGVLPFNVAGVEAGTPYYDISFLLPKNDSGFFVDGTAVEDLLLTFLQRENVRFDYDLVLLGDLNLPPWFTSDPYANEQGQAYPLDLYADNRLIPVLEIVANGNDNQLIYKPTTADPENDLVDVSILTGPSGMTIDAEGNLIWAPTPSDIGTHAVRLRATDEFGSFDPYNDQQITIRVVGGVANRPPRFTTDPVTTATVGQLYSYDSDAFDADGDDLTYSGGASYINVDGALVTLDGLVGDSDGFAVDSETGIVSWTPPSDARNQIVRVDLQVTDGNGPQSLDTQSYDVVVAEIRGNRPPIITSDAPTRFDILRVVEPQITGGAIVETTDPGLAAIRGQTFIDINANGIRDRLGDLESLIELAPLGSVVPGLEANDDGASELLNLGFTFEFYGENYTQFHVNNNGNISFGGAYPDFIPAGFPLPDASPAFGDPPRPMVAAFWADIDTRAGSEVHWTTGTSSRGNSYVQIDWPDVGYYHTRLDKLNDFTLYIEDDPDGDIVAFVYENMEWTTGIADPGTDLNGFGGDGATIGFVAADGLTYQSYVVVDDNGTLKVVEEREANGQGVRPNSPETVAAFSDTIIAFRMNPFGEPVPFTEPGVDGFLVEIVDTSNGSVVDSHLTETLNLDGNAAINPFSEIGVYRFENLIPGTYEIRVVPRDPWVRSAPPVSIPQVVTVGAGERIENIDVGFYRQYLYPVMATDPDGDELTFTLVSAPNGDAAIDPATGRLNWFPSEAGSYDFVVTVEDGRGGRDEQGFTLNVLDDDTNLDPVITSNAPTQGSTSRPYSYAVRAEDANLDPLTFELTEFPTGMTIDAQSGVITWTPQADQIGTFPATVRVLDPRGGSDEEPFIVVVTASPQDNPPEIISTPVEAALIDHRYFYQVVATDLDNDPIVYDIVNGPEGMWIQEGFGYLYWTPDEDQAGTHQVVLRARSGLYGSDLQTYEIIVHALNEPPKITSIPSAEAGFNELYTYQVVAIDPNGDDLSYEVDPLSEFRGITIDANGLLQWTPPGIGVATIGVRVTDGRGGEDVQFFDLNVVANAAPQISAEIEEAIFLNEAFTVFVTAEDFEDGASPAPGLLTFSLDQPSVERGVFIDPATGVLSWTPFDLGTYVTNVTVTDSGGASSSLELILPVNQRPAVNDPPLITSTPTGPAVRDRAWTYNVTATDPDNDSVTLTLVDSPAWLQAINPSTGPGFGSLTLTGTPDAAGSFAITVQADDGQGHTYEQSFDLVVISNAPPIIVEAVQRSGAAVGLPGNYNVVAFDPNGDDLSFEFVSGPGNGSFGPVTDGAEAGTRQAMLSFTPDSDGTREVVIRVSDGIDSATHVMTLIITDPSQVPPVASLQAPTLVFVGDDFVAQVDAADENNDILTYSFIDSAGRLFNDFAAGTLAASAARAPVGAAINPNTGLITWTPTADQVQADGEDPYQFNVRISDGRFAVDLGPVEVRVAERPALPQNPPHFVRAVSAGVIMLNEPSELPFEFIDFDGDAVDLSFVVTQGTGTGSFDWVDGTAASDDHAFPSSTTLTFVPTVSGPIEVEVTVSDAISSATHIVNLDVVDNSQPNRQPIVSLAARTATAVDELFVAQVEASDPDGDALTYGLSFPDAARQPNGLVIDALTGRISWTPGAADVTPDGGLPYLYTVTVDDGNTPQVTVGPVELTVVSRFTNEAPVITSMPSEMRGVGDDILVYQATAEDPDGDPVLWSIESGVSGATIDPVSGRFVWRPDNSIREEKIHLVLITATDPYGASDSQLMQIRETPGNTAPRITSTPPQPGFGGEDYNYLVRATDADSDAFTFSLTGETTDLTITPITETTARLSWRGPAAEATRDFQIVVTDVRGLSGSQSVQLTIGSEGTNPSVDVPPTITSTPVLAVLQGDDYRYQVVAEDPDGPMVYGLDAPDAPWLSISSDGLISGTAPADGIADPRIKVTATQAGVTASQTYTLTINDLANNTAPEITVENNLTAVSGERFIYDVIARDADGDYPLQYFLVDDQGDDRNQFSGFEISTRGRVSWTAAEADASFVVRVRDARGAVDQATFNVAVTTDNPPIVQLEIPSGPTAVAGQLVAIYVLAQDDHGVLGESRRVTLQNTALFGASGKELDVAADGVAHWLIPADFGSGMSGSIPVTVTGSAADTANQRTDADSIVLEVQPRNEEAPVTRFFSPRTNTLLEESFNVFAKAYDNQGDLIRYTLTILGPDGSETELVNETGNPLANFGSATASPGVLATIDPAAYPNGDYRLQLVAEDQQGNTSLSEIAITLEGGIDAGNMEVSFVDLTIPIRGFPITITRSYDSERSETLGDFGYGWDLEIAGIAVEVEYPDNVLHEREYPTYEDGVRVVFGLPDGTKEGFRFAPQPSAGSIGGNPLSNTYIPLFIPETGVNSKLAVGGPTLIEKTGNGRSYRVYGGTEHGTPYNPADPALRATFQLTLRNGTVLTFSAETGELRVVEDRESALAFQEGRPPAGNRLLISSNGIESSAGRGVQFIRGTAGRITRIIDPAGNALVYAYDDNGNLESFTDRTANVTRYEYNAQNTHDLERIIDPLGRSVARTFYDEFGRIDRVLDTDNQLLDHQWNLAGDTLTTYEVMEDDTAIQTVTTFDINENPLRVETTLLGGVTITDDIQGLPEMVSGGTPIDETSITIRSYNNRNQVLTETIVVGDEVDTDVGSTEDNDLTTTYVYNINHELVETVDPRGNSSATGYNEFGQPVRIEDQFGNVTVNNYDSRTGQLVAVTTVNSSSRFTYDSDGNLEIVYDSRSDQLLVSNQYNRFGDVISTTDANGNTTFFDYDDLGNQIESWRFETFDHDFEPGTPDKRYEFRTSTRYDDENRVISVVQTKTDLTDAENPIATELSRSDSNNKNGLGQDLGTSFQNSQSQGQAQRTETVYDLRGQVIETRRSAFDSDGNEVWFASRTAYDSSGRVAYSTDEYLVGTPVADIYGIHNVYDAQDRVVRSERVKGLEIFLEGTGSFQQSRVAQSGSLISYTATEYDNAGRIESSTSFNTASADLADGLTTSYTYNRYGDTTEIRAESWNAAGDGKVVMIGRTVYDEFGRAIFNTDPYLADGSRPVYATETLYDEQGRVYSTIRYEGADVAIADGTTTIVSRGAALYSTATSYDDRGRIASSFAADGQVTSYEYDSQGHRIATIEAAVVIDGVAQRHRTETIYNSRGRVEIERSNVIHDDSGDGNHDRSAAQETRFSYDENGNIVRTTFDDGSFAQVLYDELNQSVAESQQVAAGTRLIWLAAENSFVDQNKSPGDDGYIIPTRLMTYDTQGRLATVTLPDSDPTDGDSTRPAYQYGYDARGQQVSIIDPLGRETIFGYDALGRQDSRTLPLGAGADGNHETLGDNVVFSETFDYDDRQRPGLQISFEGVHMVPVYDDVTGRLVGKHYFNDAASYNAGTPDEVRSYQYDDYGRQVGITHSIAGSVTRTEMMTYDDRGLLESVTNDEGTILYLYDNLGRQIEVRNTTASAGIADPLAVDYENITTYAYDELGRLKAVTAVERNDTLVDADANAGNGNQHEVTGYAYDLAGNLSRTTYSNGMIHDYEYDDLNRLDRVTHFIDNDGDGQVDTNEKRLEFIYDVRADGKRESAAEIFYNQSGTQISRNDIDWVYDDIGRLASETFDSTDDSLDYLDSFVYDRVGNRKSTIRDWWDAAKDDYTTTYQYDANDRLETETKNYIGATPDEVITYGYDQTQQTSKGTEVAGVRTARQTFDYNLQGRLSSVTTDKYVPGDGDGIESTETIAYGYDAVGNRVRRTHTAHGIVTVTEYLTDTENHTGYSQVAVESRTVDGFESKRVVYTVGHDQISQTIFDAANPEGITHHFGTDGHGSVRVLYDLAAAVVQDISSAEQVFHYDAFGNLLNFANGVTPLTSYLYSGEAFDFNINQQYLRARYYDPASGRFNRLDDFAGRIQDPQSLHKYLYAHGDPVNGIDPTGQFLGGFGGFAGSLALNLSYASIAVTAGSSITSAGVYSFYFNASPIKGGLVGAQIGAALSVAFSLGGGGPKGWENVGSTAAAGFFAGINKLISKTINLSLTGDLQGWDRATQIQDFYEGFAAGVWSRTFGDFLDLRTGIDDPLKRAMASLIFTATSQIVAAFPDIYERRIPLTDVLGDVVYNTIPAWLQGSAIDGVLAAEGIPQPLRGGVKTTLGTIYLNAADALVEIFEGF